MKVTQLNKLKVGDSLTYQGKKATVTFKRPPYESNFFKDDKGKLIEYPDKSIGIAFVTEEGKAVHIESRTDSRMIVDEKFTELDWKEIQ